MKFFEKYKNKNRNVDLAKLPDQKVVYEFAIAMYLDEKALRNESTGEKSLIKLSNTPAFMASGISTKISPEKPNELCDRLKLLLQEKQAGDNSDLIIEEVFATVYKLLEYKCISTEQSKCCYLNV